MLDMVIEISKTFTYAFKFTDLLYCCITYYDKNKNIILFDLQILMSANDTVEYLGPKNRFGCANYGILN